MSKQRKADMEAALTELKFEIDLAIEQAAIADNLNWTTTFIGPDGEPWIAVLTIGKVSAQ